MIRDTHHSVVVKQGQGGSLPRSQQHVTSTPHKPPTTQNHVKELKKLVELKSICSSSHQSAADIKSNQSLDTNSRQLRHETYSKQLNT